MSAFRKFFFNNCTLQKTTTNAGRPCQDIHVVRSVCNFGPHATRRSPCPATPPRTDTGSGRQVIRQIVRPLNQRTLLPAKSDVVRLETMRGEEEAFGVQIHCQDGSKMVLPLQDGQESLKEVQTYIQLYTVCPLTDPCFCCVVLESPFQRSLPLCLQSVISQCQGQ